MKKITAHIASFRNQIYRFATPTVQQSEYQQIQSIYLPISQRIMSKSAHFEILELHQVLKPETRFVTISFSQAAVFGPLLLRRIYMMGKISL